MQLKATTTAILLLVLLITTLIVEAQVPTLPDVDTLGPVIICSSGGSGTNVNIASPRNQTYVANPVQLSFTVVAIGMFAQFSHIGYSVNGGTAGIPMADNNLAPAPNPTHRCFANS